MLAQNEPVARLAALEHFDRLLGETEAGHEIGHEAHPVLVDLGALGLAVRLIDQAEHRGRMGVIDEFVRQECVQHDLDRGIGRCRIDEIGALDAHQFLIVDRIERAQPTQGCNPHGGKTRGLNGRHLGAGGFDTQHLDLFAEAVGHARFQRGVAAAMQHQLGVTAEQARGVDAQRQLAINPGFGALRDQRLGVALDPPALHRALPGVPSGRLGRAPARVSISRRRCGATTSRCGAADPAARCRQAR